MSKHAYLIVAHNNWNILDTQLKLIDNEKNDIFLFIDKKSMSTMYHTHFSDKAVKWCKASITSGGGNNMIHSCLCDKISHSKLYISEGFNIYWAAFSQVHAYITLLELALRVEQQNDEKYSYFHLGTGTCLPLKPQWFIHQFCDNSGKEFIGIVPKEFSYCTNRTKTYWIFLNNSLFRRNKWLKAISYGLALSQKFIGINRLYKTGYSIYNGWANCSISHDFVVYLLKNKDIIYSMFKRTLAPDELWLQTMAFNSQFKDRIYDITDLRNGSMRFIDWERGKPYVWGQDESDFEMLVNSPYLFARKFDENVNMDIVNRLYDAVMKMGNEPSTINS